MVWNMSNLRAMPNYLMTAEVRYSGKRAVAALRTHEILR